MMDVVSVLVKLKSLEETAVAGNKHPLGKVHVGMVQSGGRNVTRGGWVLMST